MNQAKTEISQGVRPAVKNAFPDVSGYDIIFIGTPNWWSSPAPVVSTFVEHFEGFAGKTVIPFCSNGGGGFGHIESDIKKKCPAADVKKGFAAYEGSFDEKQITSWLRTLDL